MGNPHKGRTGLTRVLFATRHSAAGLAAMYRTLLRAPTPILDHQTVTASR